MAERNGFASVNVNEAKPPEEQETRQEAGGDVEPCPACEGRRVKVVLPLRGLVVAAAGESGVLEPERDVCSWCAGSGLLSESGPGPVSGSAA
jgi:hypothetical protein